MAPKVIFEGTKLAPSKVCAPHLAPTVSAALSGSSQAIFATLSESDLAEVEGSE